jgi:hypothetical protein
LRPIGYIPNLQYGKGTSNKNLTRNKIQDEHSCISFAFQSLKNISKKNGFQYVVLAHSILAKVWIHFLFEIPKATINGWDNILGKKRVPDIHIVIASVSFMI